MHKTVCGDAPDYLKMVLFLHLKFIQDFEDHHRRRPNTELIQTPTTL